MNQLFKSRLAIAVALAMGLVGCSEDEPGGSKANDGYGEIKGNLVTTGTTRDITYTSCVLLGTMDVTKITDDYSCGIVYMEALSNPDFDYDGKLQYGGHSDKYDKEDYDCTAIPINSLKSDGKFEKQIVNLKPGTKYYYRAYANIGRLASYSNVESFTTTDPSAEITMLTSDPTDIYAVSGTMNGVVNIGKLQDVNEDQEFGFIFATASQLNGADKLTYEYYHDWLRNHFETEDEFPGPEEVTTTTNLNGRISVNLDELRPGVSYYYRTFFKWNDKYFYSPEVKTLKTHGSDVITVGTNKATEVTAKSAELHASIPFSLIGLENVPCGFMISQVYSNASEFVMNENVCPWHKRYEDPDAEMFYISNSTAEKDFSMMISGLSPETTYYVCGYIRLNGEYIYGSMQSFKTEKADSSEDPDNPDNPERNIEITTSGAYPWTNNGDGSWTSGNAGQQNSISTLTVKVTHAAGQTLSFDWSVSSEKDYDGLRMAIGSEQSELISGNISDSASLTFDDEGVTVIIFQYSKDGSDNDGSDCATVRNFRLI